MSDCVDENAPERDSTSPALASLPKSVRFSIADGVMLIVAAALASALYAKIYETTKGWTMFQHDGPILVVLAIVLTAVALGSYKAHSVAQIFLQVALGCLGYLSLIWIAETTLLRPLVYWLQVSFALTVAVPMLARRFVKTTMPRGPRRTFWKKTLEAIVFSFLNLMLVATGAWLESFIVQVGGPILG